MVSGRDFVVDGYIEAAEVRAGDSCPECNTEVVIDRAIEIGHIFQLGRKYAEALDLKVLDENGKLKATENYAHGIKQGVFTDYYSDGKTARMLNYKYFLTMS